MDPGRSAHLQSSSSSLPLPTKKEAFRTISDMFHCHAGGWDLQRPGHLNAFQVLKGVGSVRIGARVVHSFYTFCFLANPAAQLMKVNYKFTAIDPDPLVHSNRLRPSSLVPFSFQWIWVWSGSWLSGFAFVYHLPICSVQFSRSVMSDSLQPHGLQLARPPCPLPTPSLLRLMSIESVMPSNHLILCCPLLFLPSIFPSIRIFYN